MLTENGRVVTTFYAHGLEEVIGRVLAEIGRRVYVAAYRQAGRTGSQDKRYNDQQKAIAARRPERMVLLHWISSFDVIVSTKVKCYFPLNRQFITVL